jgi:cation diffusion facilitator family transporter
LGILAEAAHSGLDLVAALMTFLAVRYSGRPPDRTHLYGHGKIENLSALGETLLLLVTCAWIVREAIQRLASHHADLEVTFWSFGVMGISIAVDSPVLACSPARRRSITARPSKPTRCIFRPTSGSSAVVIAGLIGVRFGL